MSKAYDRVELPFLQAMLTKLGFNNQLVELIMKYVSSVRYHIKVNGGLTEEIIPTVLPLSPYLFLICAEGFSSLLQHAEQVNMIQGIRLSESASSISHFLFADESLI